MAVRDTSFGSDSARRDVYPRPGLPLPRDTADCAVLSSLTSLAGRAMSPGTSLDRPGLWVNEGALWLLPCASPHARSAPSMNMPPNSAKRGHLGTLGSPARLDCAPRATVA